MISRWKDNGGLNDETVFDGIQTSWEKKKMLVTSIFFFHHNVFKYPIFSESWKDGGGGGVALKV